MDTKTDTVFLETQRLVLRKFKEEDFNDFFEFSRDPELCRMMGRDIISCPEDARPTFDWLMNKEERGYAIVYKETGRVIGNLTVYNSTAFLGPVKELEGKKGRSLSFSISRRYRRQGLMFEAVSRVIEHLFVKEDADFIHCGFFKFNTASAALQEKLGFSRLSEGSVQRDGETIDAVENILWRK